MPPQAPPSFTTTLESLIANALSLINKTRRIIDKIVKEVMLENATFKNVVLPIALDKNDSSLFKNIISFYQSVSTDENLYDALTEAEKMIKEFDIKTSIREDIYKLVEAVF